ncbi:hypothetical protein SLE2022_203930 [Rubroshorea leprosula]
MAMTLATGRTQAPRSERHMFASSDDQVMLKQILSSHAPDGREIAARPILHIVEDIFRRASRATPAILQGTQAQPDALDEKALQSATLEEVLDLISLTLSRISCEIACKCSGSGDAHATTVSVCNMITSYSWDAKVVLVLAAFAVNYGEFWLVAQLYTTNPLAKGVAILKQLPEVLESAEAWKPKFEALTKLLNALLDVAKCIVDFKELPAQYISPDAPEMVAATAHIPTAVYWTIRGIIACASVITSLTGMGHEHIVSTSEAWELSSLAHKISNIHSHLMKQLRLCYQHIEETKQIEAFQAIVRIFETPHMDNMKILNVLFFIPDGQPPLFEGTTKKRVGVEPLRRKIVMLLISDLDVLHEELLILDQIYQEARQHPNRQESQYEVVWMPVVDRKAPWDEKKQKQFENLQGLMPWFSVHHHSVIDPAVIRYIKEVWRFNKRPMLVVLDPQGKVVNTNAIHMIWIWGSPAYPFTSTREETLWKEESWKMELLADNIEPAIFNWIAEGKYICLYGGEDIEWIRKLIALAQAVAQAANIKLEMLYVGKSNPREKVRKNNTTIATEKLSHVFADVSLIWFFWVRLESMWHSKMQRGMTVENDPIMQEIMTMLSFDGSDQGWAVICHGSAEMTRAKGDTLVKSLNEFNQWKEAVNQKGFVRALSDYLHGLHTPHHCNRLILPGTSGSIPERVVCAECGRVMEKFFMYRCCTD